MSVDFMLRMLEPLHIVYYQGEQHWFVGWMVGFEYDENFEPHPIPVAMIAKVDTMGKGQEAKAFTVLPAKLYQPPSAMEFTISEFALGLMNGLTEGNSNEPY